MDKDSFEDCRVGERVRSLGRTITETDVVLFAAFTGDWFPIHTDAEYAKETPFGERIAHGMLVLTVGSALLLRVGQFAVLPRSTIALYGVDKVRFTAPAKIGDTIHTESEVIGMTELDGARGLLTVRGEIKNQRGELLATFTMKALVGRRGAPIAGSPPATTGV
jgi:3-hydroxybutyryl-CoA dehydratase